MLMNVQKQYVEDGTVVSHGVEIQNVYAKGSPLHRLQGQV